MGRPKIVCLCGSTRFYDEFQQANYAETMSGHIVVSVGFYPRHEGSKFAHPTIVEKQKLDVLHMHKIDLSERVHFINKAGYIGESTTRELAYSVFTHKEHSWYDQVAGEQFMIRNRHMLGAMIAVMADNADPSRWHAKQPHNKLTTWERLLEIWNGRDLDRCETCELAARLRSQGETATCETHPEP